MARRVLMDDVRRERVRGRPRLGWMEGVKVALGSRGTTAEAGRKDNNWSGDPWCIIYVDDWF